MNRKADDRTLLLWTGVLTILCISVGGCGTVLHGTKQDVGITSQPTGANVKVDGANVGITPVIAQMARNRGHVVRVEMPGYQPADVIVTRKLDGWLLAGDIVLYVVPALVDWVTGGFYNLTPENVSVDLMKGGLGHSEGETEPQVFVVLKR